VVVSFEGLSRFCKREKGGFCKEIRGRCTPIFVSSNRKMRIKTIFNLIIELACAQVFIIYRLSLITEKFYNIIVEKLG